MGSAGALVKLGRGTPLFDDDRHGRFPSGTRYKSCAGWGEVPGDTGIAWAILNQLLHHSHVLNIRGANYRLGENARLDYSFPCNNCAPVLKRQGDNPKTDLKAGL